jgi:hypothetical protein
MNPILKEAKHLMRLARAEGRAFDNILDREQYQAGRIKALRFLKDPLVPEELKTVGELMSITGLSKDRCIALLCKYKGQPLKLAQD